jgi:hypothetical protein
MQVLEPPGVQFCLFKIEPIRVDNLLDSYPAKLGLDKFCAVIQTGDELCNVFLSLLVNLFSFVSHEREFRPQEGSCGFN